MNNDERNTHFQGFAKSVRKEMEKRAAGISLRDYTPTYMEKIRQDVIAQCAYDLACHVAGHVSERAGALMETEFMTPQEVVSNIPDLTEWPELLPQKGI